MTLHILGLINRFISGGCTNIRGVGGFRDLLITIQTLTNWKRSLLGQAISSLKESYFAGGSMAIEWNTVWARMDEIRTGTMCGREHEYIGGDGFMNRSREANYYPKTQIPRMVFH